MRWTLSLVCLTSAGCTVDQQAGRGDDFIDAFYSFDADRLRAASDAPAAETERVLYYQAWARAANYRPIDMQPCVQDATDYICRVRVEDDFGKTLGYTATDTFRLNIEQGEVTSVSFSGDDPPIFTALFAWIESNDPAILTGPCRNMFTGGTTPAACARAVVAAARVFMQQRDN